MKVVFEGLAPKDLSCPERNEDVHRITEDGSVIALCDGASESFDSKTWAAILAGKFLHEQVIGPEWIEDAISSYKAQFACREMSWSKQAAFERGSFSTLLGVTCSASDKWVEITGIGDSLALLLHGHEIIDSFPYTSAEEFQRRPELLSTIPEHNRFLFSGDYMSRCKKAWKIDKEQSPCLLLLTDALAEWVLRNGRKQNKSLKNLLQISNQHDFLELILSERNIRRMRTDDSTLIKVLFEGE